MGTATLTYDANRNMLSDGTNSFVWNARNQLASMNLGGNSFQYDPFGRRTSKSISGTATNFLCDGANPVQELSGTTPTANPITGGIDEYFTRADSSGARSFLTDALGSSVALADSTGAIQTQYTFEAFGNTTVSGAATTNSFAYTGRELDATGLYFYRARYYNPAVQRFTSEDPARFRGGINLYRYAYDSPTVFTDPFGLWTVSLGGTINVSYGFGSFQYSGGFVIDTSGDIGVYNTFFGGGAFSTNGLGNFPNPLEGYPFNNISPPKAGGLSGSLGLTFGVSNAKYICDLSGPFVNGSLGFGEGLRGSGELFGGDSPHGTVIGGDVTLGGGGALGSGSGSLGGTITAITPLAGRYTNACRK